ncbi:MAG TPA: DUF3611 family protein [Chroococcidiopsis sp.]
MYNTPSSPPSPANLSPQQVASALRVAGWGIFWVQLLLGVVAALVLIFFISLGGSTGGNLLKNGVGIFFALLGLITLGISIFFAFRYTRIARQLQSHGSGRPTKGQTIMLVQKGLLVNLVGMLFTIFGAQAIIGTILAIALSQPQGWILRSAALPIVQPLDLFVVQSNINAVTAHFIGIAASFWLLLRLRR